jgi:hypothetical protein
MSMCPMARTLVVNRGTITGVLSLGSEGDYLDLRGGSVGSVIDYGGNDTYHVSQAGPGR